VAELPLIFLFTVQNQIPMMGYCYFANRITTQSEQIALNVYDLEWFGQSIHFRKSMIRIMGKSQNPEYLTAGKLFSVSLSNYGKVSDPKKASQIA
jgi:7tm Odorant receptor